MGNGFVVLVRRLVMEFVEDCDIEDPNSIDDNCVKLLFERMWADDSVSLEDKISVEMYADRFNVRMAIQKAARG